MTSRTGPPRRAMAAWLLACCALVFAIVVVGGITRLTHSGLSIVEWQPLVGAVPPLNEGEWRDTFARYRATPEFRLRNFDMTLQGFKRIFWWEYVHRLLGRAIGVAFLVPFLYFLARGAVSRPIAWRLAGIFALGGLQGALGWFMVKSGLVDDPSVSSLRLAAHLGTAFLIYAAMLWLGLGLAFGMAPRAGPRTRRHAAALAALVFVMVLSGALVAGIHAGLAYNTYPLMDGHWVPPEILLLDPWWRNLVYNMATVQFDHRVLALAVAATALALCARVLRDPGARALERRWAAALAVAVALQLTAGISTLLLRVPLTLAALHQAGALVVFTCAVGLLHALARTRELQP
ncbi:MAG TPA: COX15/CtaA family protein [Usitatibacter sp.]|nr:COX15/CtaA family protein [Usitatibacter sp.]